MKRIIFLALICAFTPLLAINLILTNRQLCDLELIMNGGFAPLEGFMNEADYTSVVNDMRLADGSLWPMPIILDVPEKMAQKLAGEKSITLTTAEHKIIATLEISDIYRPDKTQEALAVYKTTNTRHPGVDYLFHETHEYYVGGKIHKVADVPHYDFLEFRKTPAQLKEYFKEQGIERVVAFQTRNPMHRAHIELVARAANMVDAHLLIHPAVGETRPGDVDHFTRCRCYKEVLKYYPAGSATLSLLPIAMRMTGPREALWHAIIRKNYGCTHFIIGRDHAGPGKDEHGNLFYGLYDAQELVKKYAQEIGIEIVTFQEVVYLKDYDTYVPEDEIPDGAIVLRISGTEFRRMLQDGAEIPTWFSYPEVIAELKKTYPPKAKQGFTLFLTGLSAAGKSTLAHALAEKLQEIQNRKVTTLDGDIVRKIFSSELGFSKEHRSLNIRRIGFVCNEITKNGGIALVAAIAPYEQDRQSNRELISSSGAYIEIYLATPIEVCEDRDPKGLYADAHAGTLAHFTGVDDPYEIPTNPELIIDTSNTSVEDAIGIVINYLSKEGYLG